MLGLVRQTTLDAANAELQRVSDNLDETRSRLAAAASVEATLREKLNNAEARARGFEADWSRAAENARLAQNAHVRELSEEQASRASERARIGVFHAEELDALRSTLGRVIAERDQEAAQAARARQVALEARTEASKLLGENARLQGERDEMEAAQVVIRREGEDRLAAEVAAHAATRRAFAASGTGSVNAGHP